MNQPDPVVDTLWQALRRWPTLSLVRLFKRLREELARRARLASNGKGHL